MIKFDEIFSNYSQPFLVFITVLGGGQEEIGWREYLQGELLKKFSPTQTDLIFWFFWGVWHEIIPYIGFLLMTMAISVVYSAIYDKSKGNLPILFLFHGRSNAAHALWYLFYDE